MSPAVHHKHPRYPGYDYTWSGAYFLTICVEQRRCDLGAVNDGVMVRSSLGELVQAAWLQSFELRRELLLDCYVIMPNHLHAVVVIVREEQAGEPTNPESHGRATLRKPHGLSSFVAGFKAASTRRINEYNLTPGRRFWQPGFYDHIIRSEADLHRIRQYIWENPHQWHHDSENPDLRPASS